MTYEHQLSDGEWDSFGRALKFAKKWCAENQVKIGVAEMAVGAGLVTFGVQSGAIDMGAGLVATAFGGANTASLLGAGGGAGIGGIGGSILGSIGIAGMGGAIGIPAALVIGGGSLVMGMAGYTVGDWAHTMTTAIDPAEFAATGSLLLIGVALMIDGARRCLKDEAVQSELASLKKRTIVLTELTSEILADSIDSLRQIKAGYAEELATLPKDSYEAAIGTGSATLGAGLGAAVGGAVAGGTVTVFGSTTIGGAALSLGLVSAPVWPIIAGVAGGAVVGYASYKAIKYWTDDIPSELRQ